VTSGKLPGEAQGTSQNSQPAHGCWITLYGSDNQRIGHLIVVGSDRAVLIVAVSHSLVDHVVVVQSRH
jgi:hypothetical protein